MIKKFDDDFDIRKIANSGQCFRFKEKEKGTFENVAMGRIIRIKQVDAHSLDFDCSVEEFENIWSKYFDLRTNYENIRELTSGDPFLCACADKGAGIRILRQDAFETFISFIISQRKSIPAIKTSIERLSEACGERIDTTHYAFPTALTIQSCDDDLLASCGLGYRLSYIKNAASTFLSDSALPTLLNELPDELLFEKLKTFNGVGDKVASCTALFGFHRLDFFPKDVWIKRALESKYPNGFNYEKYAPYNGVIQQYIFFSYRPGLTEL